jgi:hypothetical protein
VYLRGAVAAVALLALVTPAPLRASSPGCVALRDSGDAAALWVLEADDYGRALAGERSLGRDLVDRIDGNRIRSIAVRADLATIVLAGPDRRQPLDTLGRAWQRVYAHFHELRAPATCVRVEVRSADGRTRRWTPPRESR